MRPLPPIPPPTRGMAGIWVTRLQDNIFMEMSPAVPGYWEISTLHFQFKMKATRKYVYAGINTDVVLSPFPFL